MRKIKIAIVDDHKLFLSGLESALLKYEDNEVIFQAYDGKDLFKKLSANPNIDVVFLDIKMPIMGGLEALEILKKKYPKIKVLILTMFDNAATASQAMELGADGYLTKNTDSKELNQAIKKCLVGERYFSAGISEIVIDGLMKRHSELRGQYLLKEILSEREIEILKLICLAYTTREISEKLFLSESTVSGYRTSLLQKTGTKNIAGLVLYSIKNNLV